MDAEDQRELQEVRSALCYNQRQFRSCNCNGNEIIKSSRTFGTAIFDISCTKMPGLE